MPAYPPGMGGGSAGRAGRQTAAQQAVRVRRGDFRARVRISGRAREFVTSLNTSTPALYLPEPPDYPSTLIKPDNEATIPVNARALVDGDTTALIPIVNEVGKRSDAHGRAEGYGVITGLDLSAGSGLILNIAAGQAFADGPVTIESATTKALTDNAKNYVWLLRSGTIQVILNTTDTATLTAPACYLGMVLTGGGVISRIDLGGVLYRKGLLYREVADNGVPQDVDGIPIGLICLTRTLTGLYLVVGGEGVWALTEAVPLATGFAISPSSQAATAPNYTADYTITLTPTGAVAPAGGQAFALADAGAGGTFHPSGVVILPGQKSVRFRYKGSAGTRTLTATASGSPYATNAKSVSAVIS